jgi:hypothetical protein
MSKRSDALAQRLEQGARALGDFAASLSEAEWQTRVPHDNRKIGVVVHHVASIYPLEIKLAQTVGSGDPVAGPVSLYSNAPLTCQFVLEDLSPPRAHPRHINQIKG